MLYTFHVDVVRESYLPYSLIIFIKNISLLLRKIKIKEYWYLITFVDLFNLQYRWVANLSLKFAPFYMLRLVSNYLFRYPSCSWSIINPLQPGVAFHTETSHLFCRAKQMTGFYLNRNHGLKRINLMYIS